MVATSPHSNTRGGEPSRPWVTTRRPTMPTALPRWPGAVAELLEWAFAASADDSEWGAKRRRPPTALLSASRSLRRRPAVLGASAVGATLDAPVSGWGDAPPLVRTQNDSSVMGWDRSTVSTWSSGAPCTVALESEASCTASELPNRTVGWVVASTALTVLLAGSA